MNFLPMGSNQKPIHPHSAVADMWRKKNQQFRFLHGEKIQDIYSTWRV